MRRLQAGLHAMEDAARRACRRGGARGAAEPGACQALAAVTAINNEMDERLDPGGPTVRQVEALDRLARLLASRMGEQLPLSPLGRLVPEKVTWHSVEAKLRAGGKLRGGKAYLRCQRRRPVQVVPPGSGIQAHQLSRVQGGPALFWWRDCSLARPVCAGSGVVARRLTERAHPKGPLLHTGIRARGWDAGEPFALHQGRGRTWLLHGQDGDLLAQALGSRFERQARPRALLLHAHQAQTHRFAGRPAPAGVSVAGPSGQVSLVGFSDGLQPRSRAILLRGPPSSEGWFGSPALLGTSLGYAAAVTTHRDLRFALFDDRGRPRGPGQQLRLRRRGLIDPLCTVVGRLDRGFVTLTVGRRRGNRATAVLAGFDDQGRFAGPATEVDFPVLPDRGCPLHLIPMFDRHVVVVATREGAGQVLWMLEYTRKGQKAGLPVVLARAGRLSGVAPIPGGFVVAWQTREPGGGPWTVDAGIPATPDGALWAARVSCR